jgi:hypothetical protein
MSAAFLAQLADHLYTGSFRWRQFCPHRSAVREARGLDPGAVDLDDFGNRLPATGNDDLGAGRHRIEKAGNIFPCLANVDDFHGDLLFTLYVHIGCVHVQGIDAFKQKCVLTDPQGRQAFGEVKNCTLVEEGRALFPDAVTARGRKHLEVLSELRRAGHRAVIFFVVQRMDAECFSPADRIDPDYGRTLRQALDDGVEALVYDTAIDLEGIALNRNLPLAL